MLSVIDELCVRRFHFILLVIQFDTRNVHVMDSLRKDPKMWADLKKLYRGNFNLYRTISATIVHS